MTALFIRFLVITTGIFIVAYFFKGIEVSGVGPAFLASLLLGLLNVSLRPVVLFFTYQLRFITLGLFTLCLNAVILLIVAYVVEGFDINGFLSALGGALVISILSAVINEFVDRD